MKTFKVLLPRKQVCRLSLKNRLAVERGKPAIVSKTQQVQFTQSSEAPWSSTQTLCFVRHKPSPLKLLLGCEYIFGFKNRLPFQTQTRCVSGIPFPNLFKEGNQLNGGVLVLNRKLPRLCLGIVNRGEWLWNPTQFFVIFFCSHFWPWPCTGTNQLKRVGQIIHANVWGQNKRLYTIVDLQNKSWYLCLFFWCLPGFTAIHLY